MKKQQQETELEQVLEQLKYVSGFCGTPLLQFARRRILAVQLVSYQRHFSHNLS